MHVLIMDKDDWKAVREANTVLSVAYRKQKLRELCRREAKKFAETHGLDGTQEALLSAAFALFYKRTKEEGL